MRTWATRVLAATLLGVAMTACTDDPGPVPGGPATTSVRSPDTSPTSFRAPSAPSPAPASRSGSRADTGPGCGQRAVDAGRFNPDCKEYQGYLDPGGAGRKDTSGEEQRRYACEQGYLPKSEC